jgi:hypothetical protein
MSVLDVDFITIQSFLEHRITVLFPILFCLINPSTLLRMLSKNQDLDFQCSITFLIPKRKELFVLFLFLFNGTHESPISLRSNSFSFYGIFKLLTLARKSYVGFRCWFYNYSIVSRASNKGKRTTVLFPYIFIYFQYFFAWSTLRHCSGCFQKIKT